ncbi:hypothetical protein WMY93_014241 [Mugilogobius chulae]|uniref:Uncharacterized protein n=1 Tax=Mugilogobius chulae TaxID=88201 RepID=A0AAW0NUE0_9GOBI
MEMMYVVFRGNKRISLRGEDLTTGKIAMIFQVRADSIYLTDDHNRAVLPLPNGAFESQDLLMSSHYEVHGESSASEGEASTSGQTPIRFAFRRPSNSTPTASTNHPSSRAKTVTIKFSEFEASVNNIKAKVTEALGHDEPIVLIDSHQNEIMDCEGTRGPAFWKQHARKIYAVPEEQLQRHRGKRRRESRQSDTSLPEVFDQIEEVVLASQGLQEALFRAMAREQLLCPKCRTDDTDFQLQAVLGLEDAVAALHNFVS